MRQGQQNRRGRGRNNNGGNNNNNNNNRKGGQNPLTRSFESNGPDMKIRGTPSHIAEKYIQLARDATSAGDPVLAENYLQHAEHYNRIILTYRDQQMSQGGGDPNAARARPAQLHDNADGDDMGEDGAALDPAEQPQPSVRMDTRQPDQPQPRGFDAQPRFEDRPQRFGQEGGQQQNNRRQHRERYEQRGDRGQRNDRQERQGGEQPRGYGQERFQGERFQQGDRFPADRQGTDRAFGGERPERGGPERDRSFERQPAPVDRSGVDRSGADRAPAERSTTERSGFDQPSVEAPRVASAPSLADQPAVAAAPRTEAPRRRERFAQSNHEQPEFLRRPVRRPRREAVAAEGEAGADIAPPAPVAADEGSRE